MKLGISLLLPPLYFIIGFIPLTLFILLYSILLSANKSFMLTLRTFAILFNVWRSGCDAFEHHLLVVVVLTPSCSASHLPVFFCSTSTTFNRFKSSIVILFKFNAKVLTILGRTVIKVFFLCFYNEFAVESSLYVLFAWHYSVSVISNQTAFHHSWGLSKRYEFASIWN